MSVTIVSFGAGDNSGAMLLGMYERGIRPDAILFADTGAEKPNTYKFVWQIQQWIEGEYYRHDRTWPNIQIVRKVTRDGNPKTLEDYSLESATLPSIAYGLRSCSQKFKHQPQEKWANHWELARAEWEAGCKPTKLLGIHAGEAHRASITEDDKYIYRYPLIEWGWGPRECKMAFERAGIEPPGKSACFFCPASKKREVLRLKKNHPNLYARALIMERNAAPNLQSIKGLGRNWSWEDLGAADDAQIKMFPEAPEMPCMCMDGESE